MAVGTTCMRRALRALGSAIVAVLLGAVTATGMALWGGWFLLGAAITGAVLIAWASMRDGEE